MVPPKVGKNKANAELKTVDPEADSLAGKGTKPNKDTSPKTTETTVKGSTNDSSNDSASTSPTEDTSSLKSKPGNSPSTIQSVNEGKPAIGGSTADDLNKDEPKNESKIPSKEMSNDESIAPAPLPRRPARPERRNSAFTTNLGELTAAFPQSSPDVCRGILVAACNNLESAFSGMLAISDDTIRPAAYVNEQIESDEQLARRLAMSEQQRRGRSSAPPSAQPRRPSRRSEYDDYNNSMNSTTDEVYEGFQKGLSETKQAVSSLWGNLKSRINGEIHDDDDEEIYAPRTSSASIRDTPLRSQWFPRQSSMNAPKLDSAPKLPPRQKTRPSSLASGEESHVPTPLEPKSVNAFGDESSKVGKSDEQEPDAFFIGESDDDDLGSLNDDDATIPKEDILKSPSVTSPQKASSPSSKGIVKVDTKMSKVEEKQDDKASEETKSAKDILSKYKNGK